jgi:hypothetical protein
MGKRSPKCQQVADVPIVQAPAWTRKLDSDIVAIMAIIAIWVVAILLVDPRGNFPLNDDWCYGRPVFELVRTHTYHLVGVVSMPIIGMVLWAVPFCLLLGPTFVALRIATLVLALGGVLALYGLLREARIPRWAALIGSLVLALNPLYLLLSHGFMTDVPTTAYMLIGMYVYAKALKRDSIGMILLGTVPACACALTRQIGFFLPFGFAIAYLVGYGVRPKSILKAALPTLITVATYLGYIHWLESTHRLPKLYNMQSDTISKFLAGGPSMWADVAQGVAFTSYLYLGLLLLPFLILTIPRWTHVLTARQRKTNFRVSLITGLVVMITLASGRRWLPVDNVKGDYIWNFGMGPLTLRDVWREHITHYPNALPEGFWIVVTVAAVIGGTLLLWHLLAAVEILASRDRDSFPAPYKALIALPLSVAAMNIALLLPLSTFAYFDRYYLCPIAASIVLVALIIGPSLKPNRLCIAGALLIWLLVGCFGIGATHDYLAWNRVRWHAVGELISTEHVNPQDIDGGQEFGAWYNFDESTLTWEVFDDYVITYGPMQGYEVYKHYTYRHWMPPGQASIYVLRPP